MERKIESNATKELVDRMRLLLAKKSDHPTYELYEIKKEPKQESKAA